MADVQQDVEIPLPLGIDTATQRELVPPTRALGVRNCHVGNGALVERRSFSRIARTAFRDKDYLTGGPVGRHGEPRALLPLGNTLLIATEESRLFAKVDYPSAPWLEVERNDAPVSFKRALHCGPIIPGDEAPYRYRNPQIAVSGNYACVTWWRRNPAVGEGAAENRGWAMIYDLANGLVIRTDLIAQNVGIGTPSTDGSNPSLIPLAANGYFYVLWIDPTANEIQYRALSTSNLVVGWAGAVVLQGVSVAGVNGTFDAAVFNNVVYVACNVSTLSILRATASGGTLTPTHGVSDGGAFVATSAIAVAVDASRVLVSSANAAGNIYAWCVSPTDLTAVSNGALTQIANAATTAFKQLACCLYRVTDYTGAQEDKATIVWCNSDGTERHEFSSYVADVAVEHLTSTVVNTYQTVRGVNLCHRPFRLSGLTTTTNFAPSFVGFRRNQDSEDTYYTYIASLAASTDHENLGVSSYALTPVARYSGLTAAYLRGTDAGQALEEQGVCNVVEHGGRYHWIGVEQVPTYDGDTRDTLLIYSLDFSATKCWGSCTYNGVTLVAGSIPRMIGPEALTYASTIYARGMEGIVPLHSPPPLELLGALGGSLTADANYYYCQTYEYTDLTGRVHRSIPSEPQLIDLIGGQNRVALGFIAQQSPVPGYKHHSIVIWRSAGNPADANAITFYRLTEVNAYNPENALIDTYVDSASDASIADNEILYTVSGELPNYPPPPSLALVLWKNRIVALDSETGKLWPSKTILEREWPGFHEGLAVGTDVHTSLPVWLSEDTDNLIVWWSDAIGVSYGEPGSDTGAIGSITQPRLLSERGVGLKYVKSLVRTQIGHMFMSERGFYLLGPDMSLKYIGELVAAYEQNVVVGAEVVKTRAGSTEVRFETQDADSYADGYVVLVYDLVKQAWHVHTRGRKPLASAVIGGNLYVATRAEGTDAPYDADGSPDASGVWLESSSTTIPSAVATDPSGPYQAQLDTSWLSFAGLLGAYKLGKLWLLGDFDGAFRDIPCDQYIDYVDSPTAQTHSLGQADPTKRRVEVPDVAQRERGTTRMFIRGFQRLIGMRLEVSAEKGALRRNNGQGT